MKTTITEMVLTTFKGDGGVTDPNVDLFNELIAGFGGEQPLFKTAAHVGASAIFTAIVTGTQSDVIKIRTKLFDVSWEYPEEVQLFAKEQNDYKFFQLK